MVSPLWWCAASLASITLCECCLTFSDGGFDAHARYAVAVSSLCPIIAVFGAKRPQDSGWKFIVGSLWFVLILPALQSSLFGFSGSLELHWAWRYFLLLLVVAGWSNYVLTRFWFASCGVVLVQLMLMAHYIPGVGMFLSESNANDRQVVAVAMVVAAVTAVIVIWQSKRHESTGLDGLWKDFRDMFGTVWALRIMERANETSKLQGWSKTLMWSGFESAEADAINQRPTESETLKMEQTMRTLLRRFVSPEWIARRLRRESGD
ncbi:MAG: hypothetical protein KDB27_30915 [Planctomycetales bacterium]|nr:hypothetical protein [Planctomycetales bacterium]